MAKATGIEWYADGIKRIALLSKNEELELARKARGGDKQARAALVEANLRFVVKVAHEYSGYGYPLADIVQEGNVGLVNAVDKFDPARGLRFISMAVWWIRARINDYVIRNWNAVRIGTTQDQKKLFWKLRGAYNEVSKLGLEPDEETKEIARQLKVREQDVTEMTCRLLGRDLSLDAPLGDTSPGREETFVDAVADGAELPADALESAQERALASVRMQSAMRALNEREREVITARHAEDKKTLKELGDTFGLSRERIRQIEATATKKLRKVLKVVA